MDKRIKTLDAMDKRKTAAKRKRQRDTDSDKNWYLALREKRLAREREGEAR